MMKHTMILMALVVSSSAARADVSLTFPSVPSGAKPMIFRKASNVYAVPGEGEIHTVSCTVSADGQLSARVVRGAKPWLYFYDRDGRREADCQIATQPARVVHVEALTIHRPIATR